MELQEIFNQVATHLIAQSQQSMKELTSSCSGKSCAYRGEDGLKCAAGCLIPDDEYDSSMEGVRVSALQFFVDLCGGKNTNAMIFLGRLQDIHDRDPLDRWKSNLIYLGEEYSLTLPPCLQ